MKAMLLALCLFLCPSSALGEELKVRQVWGPTHEIHDALFTPESLFVATSGGVQKFDRSSRKLLKHYTTLDGLTSLKTLRLTREGTTGGGALIATTERAECLLVAERFQCRLSEEKLSNGRKSTKIGLRYYEGSRVTVSLRSGSDSFVGTSRVGAFLNGQSLSTGTSLPAQHVTSLAVFQSTLWVGTFNDGLLRQEVDGRFVALSAPGQLINALATGRDRLFVATSDGLYSTTDGRGFVKDKFVDGAVVGLAYDGVSMWAATPGALYRVREGRGPPSDVWWMPGGSRSLQKLSFRGGFLWIGTEDRGALRLKITPVLVSRDRPFAIFDLSAGMPSSWSLSTAAIDGGGALMTTLREGLSLIRSDGISAKVPTTASPWGLSALADGSHVWVGTQDGALRLSLKDLTSVLMSGLPDPRVHAFLRDPRTGHEHTLWVGTEGGLASLSLVEP